MKNQSRRVFLKVATISVAGICFPLFIGRNSMALTNVGAAQKNEEEIHKTARRFFSKEIGESFKKSKNSKGKMAEVSHSLKTLKSEKEFQATVAKLVDKDYLSGNCFYYKCWLLSDTEGALCALLGS